MAASGCITKPVAVHSPALDLGCDNGLVQCSGDCDPLPVWSSHDFDDLLTLGASDRLVLEGCRSKLKACQACLNRGREAGVIR